MEHRFYIARTPYCYIAHYLDLPHICATGETYEKCIANLITNRMIWDEETHYFELNELLIENNIKPIEE